MKNDQQKPASWGRPSAFVWFFICVTVIGLAAATHWRALDIAFGLIWLAFLVVGSFVVLWRGWKHRAEPGAFKLGQLAALPPSWQRWVLGESKDDRSQ
jgi:hypothetical protein